MIDRCSGLALTGGDSPETENLRLNLGRAGAFSGSFYRDPEASLWSPTVSDPFPSCGLQRSTATHIGRTRQLRTTNKRHYTKNSDQAPHTNCGDPQQISQKKGQQKIGRRAPGPEIRARAYPPPLQSVPDASRSPAARAVIVSAISKDNVPRPRPRQGRCRGWASVLYCTTTPL